MLLAVGVLVEKVATQVKRNDRVAIGSRDHLVVRRHVTALGNVVLTFADRPTRYYKPHARVLVRQS